MTGLNFALETEKKLGALISARVAELRRREGLSLNSLAERARLSKGTVVGIENEQANPSIGVLCRLAAALSVSVADLVGDHGSCEKISMAEKSVPKKLWTSPNGGEAILEASTSGVVMFELWSWVLGKDEQFESEAHSPGTVELIAVRSGSLAIKVGSDELRLNPGETARLRTDQPHSYSAIGNGSVYFTMAVLERSSFHFDVI